MKDIKESVMRYAIFAASLCLLILGGWQVLRYFAVPEMVSERVATTSGLLGLGSSPSDTPSIPQGTVEWQVETVASNLEVPWSLVFPTSDTILFTERPGQIRLIQSGSVVSDPAYVFPDVRSSQEQGLMGLALHPNYSENGWIYTCVSLPDGAGFSVKIARLRAENPESPTSLVYDRDILTDIAGARVHSGCALTFGPDEKLYVATGDAIQRTLAKDQNSLVGKVLRLNDDGSIPSDNPFLGLAAYSTGHRNPQGLAWHANGSLYSSEHGPSVFDGPAGGDEINRILPGEFYGWPDVSHERTQDGARSPIALYTPAEAPASLMAYSGSMFPQYANNLFFGALRGEGLWRLEIDPNNPDVIVSQEKMFNGEYGRIRNVAEAPDGSIYFTSSNRDGRGDPTSQDDRILRLVPRSGSDSASQ